MYGFRAIDWTETGLIISPMVEEKGPECVVVPGLCILKYLAGHGLGELCCNHGNQNVGLGYNCYSGI